MVLRRVGSGAVLGDHPVSVLAGGRGTLEQVTGPAAGAQHLWRLPRPGSCTEQGQVQHVAQDLEQQVKDSSEPSSGLRRKPPCHCGSGL